MKVLDWIKNLSTTEAAEILAIITACVSACSWIIKRLSHREYKRVVYYNSRAIFTDRIDSLQEITTSLRERKRIINIYGKRGIGKSAFLRYFCDLTNHRLTKENKKTAVPKGKLRLINGLAIYIHLSGDGTQSVDAQIVSQIVDAGSTISEIAFNIAKTKYKHIYIVIDNINNIGLSKEVETIIDIFLSSSQKYCFIVGSIEKLPFLNFSNESQIKYIELHTFSKNDLFDFAKNNGKSIPSECLARVLDFSDGLPVFITLLLSNSSDMLSSIQYDKGRINSYIRRIIGDLNERCQTLAQYIAFLSITNSITSVNRLKELCDVNIEDLLSLDHSSLIELNRRNGSIKMHELFRNYFCYHHPITKDIIDKVYEFFLSSGSLYEQAYYSIFQDAETNDGIIKAAIDRGINEENYAFLIMLGEHFKQIHYLELSDASMRETTFLNIIYGYVEGLIGVGDYPAAREVIDRTKISARSFSSDLQFRFSISVANLYHLQNDYEEAIATYQILLDHARSDNHFNLYQSQCLYGIAHSLRHKGYDLEQSIVKYDEAILYAEQFGQNSIVIKCMREKLIILLCQNRISEAKTLHQKIWLQIKHLPKDGYKQTRLSVLKTEANYLLSTRKNKSELELTLLNKVYSEYKAQRKRLQYNLCFQIGEHFRSIGDLKSAEDYYNMSLSFSKKIHDRNLESLSTIAIIICELAGETYDKKILVESTINCIELCDKHELYTNKLLAEVLLAYLDNTCPDAFTTSELKRIKYYRALKLVDSMCKESLQQLDLYLM